MSYQEEISAKKNDPQQLEALYQAAQKRKESGQFAADLNACLAQEPNNLLLQAWYFRLLSTLEEAQRRSGFSTNWKLAIPLAIANGLILWVLSDPGLTFERGIPYLFLLAAPIIACFVMGFLSLTTRNNYRRTLAICAGLAVVVVASLLLNYLVALKTSDNYLVLMVPHLGLLAWAGIGVAWSVWRPMQITALLS